MFPKYFAVTGIMKGVWREAFGIEQLYLGNVALGLDIQYLPSLLCPVLPLTPCGIRLGGELAIGRDDCFVTEEGWGLAKYDGPPAGDAPCIRAQVASYMSMKSLFSSYFVGEFDGLNLDGIVRAFGTREQADAFKDYVPKLVRDSGFKPMRWDRDGEGCAGNPCISFTPSIFPVLTLTQRKVLPGLRLFGELTVLGVTAAATVIIDPSVPYLLLEAKLHPIVIGGGTLKLVRSASAISEGPLLKIEIMLASGRKPLPTAIASAITDKFKSGSGTGPSLGSQLRDAFAINASGIMEAEVMLWGASASVGIVVDNSGFRASFGANIGAGAGAGVGAEPADGSDAGPGGGFAVDVVLESPYDGLDELSFQATATLQGDFGDALGAAAADAMLALGESIQEAAEDARDLAGSAIAMVGESDAAETVQTALKEAFAAIVAKGKDILEKCTGPCEAALGLAIAGYNAAVDLAQGAIDAALELWDSAKGAAKEGWQITEAAFDELPETDKIFADVVELISSAVDVAASAVSVESAVFSATIGADTIADGADNLVFNVALNATFLGDSLRVDTELEVNLNDIAAAAAALAADVVEKIRGSDRRRARSADGDRLASSLSGWVAANWPSQQSEDGREPLSQFRFPATALSDGSTLAKECTKDRAQCARSAMEEATTNLASFKGAAAHVESAIDAVAAAVDVVQVAFGAFDAISVASVENALEVASESVEQFTDAVTEKIEAVKDADYATIKQKADTRVKTVKRQGVAAVSLATGAAGKAYDLAVSVADAAYSAAIDAAEKALDLAEAAVDAAVEAGNSLIDGAFDALEKVAGGVGDLLEALGGAVCSVGGSRKDKKGKETNGGTPEACLCDVDCKFPSCTWQQVGWGFGKYCAGTRKQENAIDAYNSAVAKAKRDKAKAEADLAAAKVKEAADERSAEAAKERTLAAADEARAAAVTAAQEAAAAANAAAEAQRKADLAAATKAKADALASLKTNTADWYSAESRNNRKLVFPEGLFALTERKRGGRPTAWPTIRVSLAECSTRCMADSHCGFFNFADPFAMLTEAPFTEVATKQQGMCQLGRQALAGAASSNPAVQVARLEETSAKDASSGKAVQVYAQYHLFSKLYQRRTAADSGASVQDCHPDANYAALGNFKYGACSRSSRCENVGERGADKHVCRMVCNSGNYRHHAEALECTEWHAPCSDSGLYEDIAGTPTSDRVCRSSFETSSASSSPSAASCCDASGCSPAAFILDLQGDEALAASAAVGAARCVDYCPDGTYGHAKSATCAACPEGCSTCAAPKKAAAAPVCTACKPARVLNAGKCTLGCSQGQHANDDNVCEDVAVCKPGTVRPAGSKTCFECPAGYMCNGSDPAPHRCPQGTMAPTPGHATCLPLVPGFYNDKQAGAMLPCSRGSACSGRGDIMLCTDGWYQPEPQQSECKPTLDSCGTGMLEAALPTSTSDRVCEADTVAPTFGACPTDIVASAAAAAAGSAPSADVARVALEPITVKDNDHVYSVEPELPEAGAVQVLAVGAHDFAYHAEDAAGNGAWCNFTVLVLGSRPPVLACPAINMRVAVLEGESSSVVHFHDLAVATDGYGSKLDHTTATPPSGSLFSIGRTTVRVAAADDAGNSAECYFAVVVEGEAIGDVDSNAIDGGASTGGIGGTAETGDTGGQSMGKGGASSNAENGSEPDDYSNGADVDAAAAAVDGAGKGKGTAGLVFGVAIAVVAVVLAVLAIVSRTRHAKAEEERRAIPTSDALNSFENPAYDHSTDTAVAANNEYSAASSGILSSAGGGGDRYRSGSSASMVAQQGGVVYDIPVAPEDAAALTKLVMVLDDDSGSDASIDL